MSGNSYRAIGPEHPITIEPAGARVIVRVGTHVLADSTRAVLLREAKYPPVTYIPREDIDMSLFEKTDHSTHCPFKGDASYYSVRDGGSRSVNAAWSYETTYEQVDAIAGYLAFYPDRVDAIESHPEAI